MANREPVSGLTWERERLRQQGRDDLAERVRHVAAIEGDGAGYDIASFDIDGTERHIEVKTTVGDAGTDFFVSANEVAFSVAHDGTYWLYRVYEFDTARACGRFYTHRGYLDRFRDSARPSPIPCASRRVSVMHTSRHPLRPTPPRCATG